MELRICNKSDFNLALAPGLPEVCRHLPAEVPPPFPSTSSHVARGGPTTSHAAPGGPRRSSSANMVSDNMATAVVHRVMEAMRTIRGAWWTERGDQGPWSPMANPATKHKRQVEHEHSRRCSVILASSRRPLRVKMCRPLRRAQTSLGNMSHSFLHYPPQVQHGLPRARSTPGTAWAVQGQVHDPQAS